MTDSADLETELRAALARANLNLKEISANDQHPEILEGPYAIADFAVGEDADENFRRAKVFARVIIALPTLLDTLTALRAQVEALGWYQMDSAPKDGTPFQALIPGHGADNIITWTDGLLDSNGEDCGAWVFASEQEPPDDWTDGYCWEVNEDGVPSTKPVLWRPLPATLESSRG